MFSEEIVSSSIKYYELHSELNSKDRINNIEIIFGMKGSTFYDHYKIYKNKIPKADRKTKGSKITPEILEYIKLTIENQKIICVKNIIKSIENIHDTTISKSYFYEILDKLKYTHKKVYIRNNPYEGEDFENMKKDFFGTIKKLDINSIISIDETAIYIDSYGNYGWAIKGKKCELFTKNKNIFKKRYSLLMAISNKQVMLYGLFEGSINGDNYLRFIQELIDEYGNKYTLLMDNARIHHTKLLNSYAKYNNVNILYNIPYNPETNPIEMCFNPIKSNIKSNDTSTIRKINISLDKYINSITSDTLQKMFNKALSCGDYV